MVLRKVKNQHLFQVKFNKTSFMWFYSLNTNVLYFQNAKTRLVKTLVKHRKEYIPGSYKE